MHVVILATAPDKKIARAIAQGLIRKKLAACVNILDKVESVFWWEGRPQRAREILLVIKTSKAKSEKAIRAVKSLHSYEVPEIIALPIIAGYRPYLNWINESVR
jgi:periplasmic divalent cation tolerance protein